MSTMSPGPAARCTSANTADSSRSLAIVASTAASLTRRVRPVSEAAVDATIARLREESAVFADVQRAAGPGDIVLMDSQRLDANGRRLSGTRSKGVRIQLG